MEYLKPRANINSLFGQYSIAQNNTDITFDNPNTTDNNIYDFVLRGKDGLQKKIVDTNKSIQALTAPTDWLTAKRADLTRIANELEAEFERVFTRQLKRNIPVREMRENTKKEVDTLYDKLLKLHHEDFPQEMLSKVVKKLTGC